MIRPDPNRGTSPPPSPDGLVGSEDPEATTSYTRHAGLPRVSAAPGGPPASPNRFDFLGPPRAEGELGRLAHYRVRSLIGEGGIGFVFLAEDTQLFRPVALKVVKPELADATGVQDPFVREAQATAAIKHDHIVTIYQVGRHDETLFLAMEYLQGMSLQSWLERGRKPSADLVLRLGREIASGLAAAHDHGLIHRDIKPANIWLEAPSGRVKILDFGMARSRRDDVLMTLSGTVVGTPAYMAPEQARGEHVGAGSDLFSLGCVLYRLCTNRLPFDGRTILAVLSALSSDTPTPPRLVERDVHPALDALVIRLLAKDPKDRPESAQSVVAAIRAIERELLAGRQKAELSEATPRPGDVETLKPLKAGLAEGTDDPGPLARPRVSRGTWLVAADVAAAVTVGGFLSFPHRKKANRGVVAQPALVKVSVRQAAGENPVRSPKDPGPSQPEAVAAHLSQGDGRGVAPNRSSPTPTAGSIATATVRDPSRDKGAGREPPETRPERPEPKGTPRESKKADREGEYWGEAVVPDGDCKIELDRTGNKIKIVVPGTPHVLRAELGRLNAPRLLRGVKGDFDARVSVAGVLHPAGRTTVKAYAPYHGAGILLWQDEENYVRLGIAADVQHGKPRPYANFEYRRDGALAYSRGLKIEDGSTYLRLRRRGDEIYAAFGPNGVQWTSFPPLSTKLKDRLSVGVSAINTTTKPLMAQMEGFEVSGRSGVGDGVNEGAAKP